MTWHLDGELVTGYVDDRLAPACASVETHLMTCADCRELLAGTVEPTRVGASWAAIADRIDQPNRGWLERALTRAGLREHVARLVVVTPSLRVPWLAAVTVLLFLSAVSTERPLASDDRGLFAFLVLAPLLPLVGIGLAFGARTDSAHELTVAAPISAIELLFVRGVAVLVTTTALTGVAALAIPANDWSAAAWLLPALGLTTAALALSRWTSAARAAAGLGLVWLLAASSVLVESAARRDLVVEGFAAFRPAGQVAFLALTIIAAGFIATQRAQFDLRRTT